MLIHYLYYSLLIISSLVFSFQKSFNTEIGICYLNIENSDHDLGLKNQIKSGAKSLVEQFGPVKRSIFYINIIANKNQMKKFPNWASGIAINNRVFIHHNKLSKTVVRNINNQMGVNGFPNDDTSI